MWLVIVFSLTVFSVWKYFIPKKYKHRLQNTGHVYCKRFDTFKIMICNCFFFRQDISLQKIQLQITIFLTVFLYHLLRWVFCLSYFLFCEVLSSVTYFFDRPLHFLDRPLHLFDRSLRFFCLFTICFNCDFTSKYFTYIGDINLHCNPDFKRYSLW